MTTTTVTPRRVASSAWLQRHPATRAFLTAPSGIAALVAIAVLVGVAIFAPIFLNGDATHFNFLAIHAPVSWRHPLGTDDLGRDNFARVLVATRLSLEEGLAGGAIGIGLGALLGLAAALSGRFVRPVLLRLIDTMLCVPGILLAILLITIIGVGESGAVIGVGVASSFSAARLTSSLALGVGSREYVSAARVVGVRRLRLMLRYALPNIAEPLIVSFSLSVVGAVLSISALSFLGLGVQAPTYDWGQLLTQGLAEIFEVPAAVVGPTVAIAFTALALGLAGEALARSLNPVLWTRRGGHDSDPDSGAEAGGLAGQTHSPAAGVGSTTAEEASSRGSAGANEERKQVLEVEDLVVTLPTKSGAREIVKGVSFVLRSGEVLGIVGESGSGKTMTALALARLTPFPGESSGTVRLLGNDLAAMPAKVRSALFARELAFVFQDPSSSFNPALRIGTQMTLAPRIIRKLKRPAARALAASSLREVHIGAPERQMRRYPHELSGGMRQRVMIATGLMAEPSVLIADEPTTALDVTVQAQIMSLIAEISGGHRDAAIILISHNLGLVSQNCDRVLVMYCGRIVEDLDTEQLRSDPKHPYTRALLFAMPRVGKSRTEPLADIGGEAPDVANPPSGCPFHPRCPLAIDRCKTERPALVTWHQDRDRRVACHLAEPPTVG